MKKPPFSLPSLVDLTDEEQAPIREAATQPIPEKKSPPSILQDQRIRIQLMLNNDDISFIEEQRAKERKNTPTPLSRSALFRAFSKAIRQSHYYFADKTEEELCQSLTKQLLK